jgi:RNA polymerase sigma-70 factor, ECF subfamily
MRSLMPLLVSGFSWRYWNLSFRWMFGNRLAKKTDEELMMLIQHGEDRALTELYQRYSKKLVRYFYRMLWKDESKAQDFLHDLFVKIIEKPEYYDTSRKFITWIYSVAHNMCKNEYRKQSFRKNANGYNAALEINDIRIHETMDNKTMATTLEKLLADSDEEDKNLFVLRCELEMTFPEIAVIMECPEGTIKSRWFYLKKRLAQQLQEYHPAIK